MSLARLFTVALFAVANASLPAYALTLSYVGTSNTSVADPTDFDFTHEAFSQDGSVVVSDLQAMVSASGPDAVAKAQTRYGVNRVHAYNNAPIDNPLFVETGIGGPFALAGSLWADVFTITGGAGAGEVAVSATITGQFGTGDGAGGLYMLAIVTPGQLEALIEDPFGTKLPTPVLFLSQHTVDPPFIEEGERVAPGSAFGGVRTGKIPFIYDQPFMLLSLMIAGANEFGELSAMNSASFGITAPGAGTFIFTQSGTAYSPAVAPVPVPAALWGLMSGVACLAVRRRRPARRAA